MFYKIANFTTYTDVARIAKPEDVAVRKIASLEIGNGDVSLFVNGNNQFELKTRRYNGSLAIIKSEIISNTEWERKYRLSVEHVRSKMLYAARRDWLLPMEVNYKNWVFNAYNQFVNR